ncbi:MAG: ABC transporter ATP-binding protein [Candidatus Bathyarchaeia archaeon]
MESRSKGKNEGETILEVRNLVVEFKLPRGILRAVDDVSLDVYRGEVLGLAGESGCGKSVFSRAIVRQVDPNGYIKSGKIFFRRKDGSMVDIMSLSEEELRNFRWKNISIVFQGAISSFNPVMRIKEHFLDTVLDHEEKVDKEELLSKASGLLKNVLLDPNRVLRLFQHEMSGGMKQRSLIALSLILDPELVILDEPTSALDVLTQAYILDILKDLHKETSLTMLFITHDLPVLAEIADRIAVMYLGKIVEIADVWKIFYEPKHPYTQGLLKSIPSVTGSLEGLRPLSKGVPDPMNPPPGCKFHTRCQYAIDICKKVVPPLLNLGGGHLVACHLYSK